MAAFEEILDSLRDFDTDQLEQRKIDETMAQVAIWRLKLVCQHTKHGLAADDS